MPYTAQDRQAERDLEERENAIRTMIRTEGWKLLVQAFEYAIEDAYRRAIGSKEPHLGALALGAHHALKSMKEWPDRELTALQAQREGIRKEVVNRDVRREILTKSK